MIAPHAPRRGPRPRSLRARLVLSAALVAAVGAAPPADAKVRRHGHGIGLSQVGAQNRAAHGWNATRILNFYYPGTYPISVPEATVRVWFYDRRAVWIRRSPRWPRGTSVRVRRGRIDFAGNLQPFRAVIVRGPFCLRRCYRGDLLLRLVGSRLRVINVVPMESYLRSVVPSEMPYSWSFEALRAQAVAARSYALRMIQLSRWRDWDVHQDTRSQAYWGMEYETAPTTAAVLSTSGRVRVHGRRVIFAMYSAANGGHTEPLFGVPYLPRKRDRFD